MADHRPETPLDRFERICRAQGLPLTVHRRTIIEILADRDDHPTADQVYAATRARLPGISRTSVYRVLDMLVATGMLTRICHPGSAARFDPKMNPHHHLVCTSCERIIDVEDTKLNRLPHPDVSAHGFQINDYHVHFRGLCADCLRKRNAKETAPRPVGRPKAGQKPRPTQTNANRKRRKS